MDKIHQKLMEKNGSYAAWHRTSHFQLLQWLLLISVVVLLTWLVADRVKQPESVTYGLQSNAAGIKKLPVAKGGVAGVSPDHVLVSFSPNASAEQKTALSNSQGLTKIGELPQIRVIKFQIPPGQTPEQVVERLSRNPLVEFAEVDNLLEPSLVPNDPMYPDSYMSMARIKAAEAWDITTGSSNVVVAICDSGIDANHPDLNGKVVGPGWNFYNNNSDTSPMGDHGTAVSSVVGAATNNGIGTVGVSWGVGLMPVRITDSSGYANDSTIAGCLNWAADHGAKVANVSYGVSISRTITRAAQYLVSKGGITVWSAGNTAAQNIANQPDIIHVSAVDPSDTLYSYSSSGPFVDISAPGDMTVACFDNHYCGGGGTSIAAPFVSGVLSLIWSVNPSLTPLEAQNILYQSADDLGPAGRDNMYGAGRLNAFRAVTLAKGGMSGDTSPPSVSLIAPQNGALVTKSSTVAIQASATDDVGITKVTFSVDNKIICTQTSPISGSTYSCSWKVPNGPSKPYPIVVKAYDSKNVSQSSISVTSR